MPQSRGYTYTQFRSAVTRFDRDTLLVLVAHGASMWDGNVVGSGGKARILQPWALAGVAYVAVRWGAWQATKASAQDLFLLSNMYANLRQPVLERAARSGEGDALRIIERFLYEQTPHQKLGLSAIARARGLFVDTDFPVHRTPAVLVEGWDQNLLGGSLDEYLATVFLLVAYAGSYQGLWPTVGWEPDLDVLSNVISPEKFDEIVGSNFTASIDELKRLMKAAADRRRSQGKPPAPDSLEFNPLFVKPLVRDVQTGVFVIPSLQLLEMKASVQSIVYAGLERFGPAFTTEVGYLFEAYVGRNLRLLGADRVKEERKYTNAEGNKVDSIDWFVVFDSVVLYVEVKAIFPPEDTRLGVGEPMQVYGAKLEKALDQLRKTNSAVRSFGSEFRDIPTDRPVIGMVVTMADFFRVPSNVSTHAIPTLFVTIDDLETWCGLDAAEAETILTELIAGRSAGTELPELRSKMQDATFLGNAVVDAAWDANPIVNLADRLARLDQTDATEE